MRHFTPPKGWINDPNGLVYFEGWYHLFYQHNPASNKWADMHWGHARSRDLVHWEHLPIALYPEDGYMMFSGSAIIDTKNVTGLKSGPHDPMLLYYTAAGEPFHQCLAVSLDGGETFQKRGRVIGHIKGSNRDPRIVYDEEKDIYRLALYLDGDEYALFTSSDLTSFTCGQTISIPDDNECPDLFPLTADDGSAFWVLMGAHDRYFVGRFGKDGLFAPVQPVGRLSYGSTSYAAQSYNGMTVRRVRLSWNQTDMRDPLIQGSMCTPADLRLILRGGRYLLCLTPIPEFGFDPALDTQGTIHDGDTWHVPGGEISLLGGVLTVNGCTCPAGPAETIRTIGDDHALEVYVGEGDRFFCVPNQP